MRPTIERIAAGIGGGLCLLVAVSFAGIQEPMWPLPGLYLLESALLGSLGFWAVWHAAEDARRWLRVLWGSVGTLLGFGLLGIFTIGIPLLMAAALFMFVGISLYQRLGQRLFPGFLIVPLFALLQGGLMFLALRIYLA